MLGRWCHRSSPSYARCDPDLKSHLANVDNNLPTAQTQRVLHEDTPRDPVSAVFFDSYGV